MYICDIQRLFIRHRLEWTHTHIHTLSLSLPPSPSPSLCLMAAVVRQGGGSSGEARRWASYEPLPGSRRRHGQHEERGEPQSLLVSPTCSHPNQRADSRRGGERRGRVGRNGEREQSILPHVMFSVSRRTISFKKLLPSVPPSRRTKRNTSERGRESSEASEPKMQ